MSDWPRAGDFVLPLLRRHFPAARQLWQRARLARLQTLPEGRSGDFHTGPTAGGACATRRGSPFYGRSTETAAKDHRRTGRYT